MGGILGCIYTEPTAVHLRALAAVETLRCIWVQQFYYQDDTVRWREHDNVPPAAVMVASPYDVEVRYSHKRGTEWRGYKVHLTETCDTDQPHLITHVETTAATGQDGDVIVPIHAALARKAVVPKEHLVDRGYPSADLLVESRQCYGINLVGPMREDQSWQARTGIEGTLLQAVFALGMRRSRYRGQAKTHVQQVMTAAAINLKRIIDWIEEVPQSQTYRSAFAQLAAA